MARGSQGGRIGVGRADRDAILRALLADPGSPDADGRRGAGRRRGRGTRVRARVRGVRGASRGSGRRRWRRARGRADPRGAPKARRVAARRRTRRPGFSSASTPPSTPRRGPRGAGGGRPPPSTSTEAVRRAPCRGARRAPAQITSARRRGDTRRGGESGCRRLRSTLGIDAERNLQPKDARVCQTGRPALAWTRERFRESRVESGVSKLARGRRYPTTRGRDARVTFAGIMADTPYVSEFRRRTHRLPRARVLDARRRWRNRESSTAPAPGPSADAQFQRPKVASSTHPPPR